MARERIDVELNLSDPNTKRNLMVRIGSLSGPYALDLRPIRPTRSQQQNRFYWGVLVESFRQAQADQGVYPSSELVSTLFKVKCGGLVERMFSKTTGELLVEDFRSTTTYSVDEMSEYLERVIAYLATEHNIVVPELAGVFA